MNEGWYVTASDINLWADRNPREAQEKLPLLVSKLILGSIASSYIRIPSDNGILLKGWDGILKVEQGNSFVSPGLIVWEFGTSKDTKTKADEDYSKRTKKSEGITKDETDFIFVTNRIWQKKNEWEQKRNSENKWKKVKVLDAYDLETWLHQCQSVHRWFARLIGKRPDGALDIEQAWSCWSCATSPASGENLIIAGRDENSKTFTRELKGTNRIFRVYGESREESYAFILASILKYSVELSPRVLIVNDSKEWLSIIESKNPLILIPNFEALEGIGLAVKNRHIVIIPESKYQYLNQSDSIRLPRANGQEIAKALIEMGITEENARNIVNSTHGFLLPIRRHPELHPKDFKVPKWASKEYFQPLATILLFGSWDSGNGNDLEKILSLSQLRNEELDRILHQLSIDDDPPVQKTGSIWQVVSRQDAWQLLSPFINEDILKRFGEIAIDVLRELDPRYKLKPEERWSANIHKIIPKFSGIFKKSITEMLAILATYGDKNLHNVREISVQDRVSSWVREILLKDLPGHRWYSLKDLFPIFAEASPDLFLSAIEEDLKRSTPSLLELFVEEGTFGGCHHAGLLWGLERISWNKDYLSRVVLILAKLEQIAPKSKWSNRPANTFREIFLTWKPQTKASLAERLEIFNMLLSHEPEVGWKFLLSLHPKASGEISTPILKPEFRDWAEGWKGEITNKEYKENILTISNKIIEIVGQKDEQWIDLTDLLSDLLPESFDLAIEKLKNIELNKLSEITKQEIYEKLFDIICNNKRYTSEKWALPKDAIVKLEQVFDKFIPSDPVNRFKYLFDKWPHDIVCEPKLDYKEEEKRADELRNSALENIWNSEKQQGIDRLVEVAKLLGIVGHHLAISKFKDEIEEHVLNWLSSEKERFIQTAQAYIFTRANNNKDYSQVIFEKYKEKWINKAWFNFCIGLPFSKETFVFLDNLSDDVKKIYWENVRSIYRLDGDKELAEFVLRQFLNYHKPITALKAATQYLHTFAKETGINSNLIVEILEQIVTTPTDPELEHLDSYEIGELLKYIQIKSDIDKNRLVKLEWLYIPYFWHGKYHLEVRPTTLIGEILDNPDWFVHLIKLAFKAKPTIEGEFSEFSSDQIIKLAENAYYAINMIKRLPGQENGNVDETKLFEWIVYAREKCKVANRLQICDDQIGEILSFCPNGKDDVWPHESVRAVIEKVESKNLEAGIEIGIYNQRGVFTKSLDEGGNQERGLSEKYAQFAEKTRMKWPRTSTMLKRISEGYIRDARNEDLRSDLRDFN